MPSIQPLLKCQWGQGSPFYNRLKFAGKYQLVGCTALAIAQIIFYWMVQRGFHRGSKPTKKYTTDTNKYTVDALPNIMVFDWQNLVPNPKTTAEKNAVATLCEYIAKALRSDFGKNQTDAKRTLVEGVVNGTFRLGQAKHVYSSTVGSAEFKRLILEDLAHGRPVFMTGQSTKSGGHAYVIDGYDEEQDKFHVNWGWKGYLDGYYALNDMKPGTYNYNGSKMMVYNIEPEYLLGDADGNGKLDIADVVTVVNAANSGKTTKQTDINSDGKTTIDDANIIAEHLVKGNIL